MRLEVIRRHLFECQRPWRARPSDIFRPFAAAGVNRIDALAAQTVRSLGRLAGLSQRYPVGRSGGLARSEAHLRALAADPVAIDVRSRPGLADLQVQADSVGDFVHAGRRIVRLQRGRNVLAAARVLSFRGQDFTEQHAAGGHLAFGAALREKEAGIAIRVKPRSVSVCADIRAPPSLIVCIPVLSLSLLIRPAIHP